MLRFSPRPNRAHLIAWREWGEEAFQTAQHQDKPVALFLMFEIWFLVPLPKGPVEEWLGF